MRTDRSPGIVECYSGHTFAQEPRAFAWQGQRQVVDQVVDRWRSPAGPAFRVRTAAGRLFDLFYDENQDLWHIGPGDGHDPGAAAGEDSTKEV